MRNLSKTRAVLAAAVVSCGVSTAANADSFGVNFTGGFNAANPAVSLADADMAGVVSQAHWNNANGASGSLTSLLDNNGANSGASVTWTSPNTWSSGIDTSTPNGKLLNGYIDSGGTAATGAKVSISGIPYAAYDLIVYLNTDGGTPRIGDYEVGTSTQQVTYEKSPSLILAPPYPNNSVATTASTPAGTYIIFPNLTGSSVTLQTNQATPANFRAPISGVQVYGVTIPEPASLGVVTALGGLLLTRSRRKPVEA